MIIRQEEFEATQSGLRVLRMSLEYSASSPSSPESAVVHCSLTRGGTSLGEVDWPAPGIGVPASREQADAKERSDAFRLPGGLIDLLKSKLATVDISPLYLAFASPSGYLPAMPWERLLLPHVGVPVLRLPGLPFRPIVPQANLTIAYCISIPIAKGRKMPEAVVDEFIDQLPRYNALRAKSHVFADRGLMPYLSRFRDSLSHSGSIELHNPDDAQKYGPAQRTTDVSDQYSRFDSPWLLWMRDELGTTGVDGVHFLCHGYLGTRGGLAVAESPVINQDLEWARFIGTRQLGLFLEAVGAWCAFFSGPPDNFSPAGMRMLQNEMSAILPIPTVLHEMEHDPQGAGLQAAYRFVFDEQTNAPPPMSEAISLVCPPSWVFPDQNQGESRLNSMFEDLTLAGRMKDPLRNSFALPGWVSAAQRSLERAVANVSLPPTNTIEQAEQQGSENALRFMADLYAKYAQQTGSIVYPTPSKEKL